MRKTSRLLALMFVAFMILGSTQVQTINSNVDTNQPMGAQLDILSPAGYDSPNITATLNSLANGSTVSGLFDITLNMTTDLTALNLYNNQISDISTLSGLTNLNYLTCLSG